MEMAHELGKPISEIRSMPLADFLLWREYFKIRNRHEDEKQAATYKKLFG